MKSSECVHNKMIECQGDYRPCFKCGWNPTVREQRVKEFYTKNPKLAGIKI